MSVPDTPPEPVVVVIWDAGPEFIGFTSLEERIFHADVIVRAKLKSLRGSSKRTSGLPDHSHWIPVITFEFEALEFLKGAGDKTLLANASFGTSGSSWKSQHEVYESKRDAIAAALHRISVRDKQWDEREAIVFMSRDQYWGGESYGFTLAGSIQAPEYRLESRYNRVWLPAADDTSQTPERFLMTAPPAVPGQEAQDATRLKEIRKQIAEDLRLTNPAEIDSVVQAVADHEGLAWSGSESAPWRVARESITLEELREAIAELEASVNRAKAEGNSGYRECLARKYDRERNNQQAIYEGGGLIRHWWRHYAPQPPERRVLFAELPTNRTYLGKVGFVTASRDGPEFNDKFWMDGPDAHRFQLEPDDDASARSGYRSHSIMASSVLSAGFYWFRLHIQEARFRPCGYYDELSATDYFVEVIDRDAPERPGPRYLKCTIGSAGVLDPGELGRTVSVYIDSSSECSSTQIENRNSYYEVFEVRERLEVEASLNYVCPSLGMLVYEGVGPRDKPLHSFGVDNALGEVVRLGAFSAGAYTVELNVPQSEECYSELRLRSNPERQ